MPYDGVGQRYSPTIPAAVAGERLARIVDRMMTDKAYIAAYQKLNREYQDNRMSMEEYLDAIEKLKAEYLKGKAGATLPVVP